MQGAGVMRASSVRRAPRWRPRPFSAGGSRPTIAFVESSYWAGGRSNCSAPNADVTYDTNTSVMTALGHVEIDYNNRILTADKVTYDQDNDVATARRPRHDDGAEWRDVIFDARTVLTDADEGRDDRCIRCR